MIRTSPLLVVRTAMLTSLPFFFLLYLSFVIFIIRCCISCSLADNFLSRIQSTRTYPLPSEYIFLSFLCFFRSLPHHCLHDHHLRLPLKKRDLGKFQRVTQSPPPLPLTGKRAYGPPSVDEHENSLKLRIESPCVNVSMTQA